jgi:hypothetical protein
MDKVRKYNSFNTNTPSSESYRNYRLGVFENRALRIIFATKREEVAGLWRKLHDEFHNMSDFPDIIEVNMARRMI